MGGECSEWCYQEKAPKNKRQLADIFRFSSLSPPPKNHLPRRHPQYPKGLFGTDIESGREPLLPPPCMWVALDFSSFLLGKDDVLCSYKTGEMHSSRPFTGETRVRSILRFFFLASRPRVGKVNFPSVTPSSLLLVVCGSEDRCRKTIKPLISPLSLSLSQLSRGREKSIEFVKDSLLFLLPFLFFRTYNLLFFLPPVMIAY